MTLALSLALLAFFATITVWILLTIMLTGATYLPLPWMDRLTRWFGSLATPLSPEALEEVERILQQGGLGTRNALESFFVIRGLLAFLVPLTLLYLTPPTPPLVSVILFLVFAIVGYLLPRLWIERRRTARQRRIRHAVPTMMEYTLPLLEAGHSVDAVLRHLALELQSSSPDLSFELRRSIARMDAGVLRAEALQELRERTGVDELDAMIQMLGHAETTGASLLDTMRELAEETRERHLVEAEEVMASRSPMFTILTIVFAMPLLLVLLVGPALLDAAAQISGRLPVSESPR